MRAKLPYCLAWPLLPTKNELPEHRAQTQTNSNQLSTKGFAQAFSLSFSHDNMMQYIFVHSAISDFLTRSPAIWLADEMGGGKRWNWNLAAKLALSILGYIQYYYS